MYIVVRYHECHCGGSSCSKLSRARCITKFTGEACKDLSQTRISILLRSYALDHVSGKDEEREL